MDASTFSRLLVGSLLVLIIFLSYIYNLDKLLILSIIILVTYDLRNIKIKNNYLLLILTLLTLIIFFLSPLELLRFICFFKILIILSIFLSNRFKKEFFIISLYLFCLILYYLISVDRIIFYTIIFLSFLNDTIAYIFGRLIGGPKIIPKISPNKTWSGTLISFSISFIFMIFIDYNIFLSLMVAISLFIGDIFFSYIKRLIMLKDFSSILGSHGGVLDRLDSMFFVTIIFQIYLFF